MSKILHGTICTDVPQTSNSKAYVSLPPAPPSHGVRLQWRSNKCVFKPCQNCWTPANVLFLCHSRRRPQASPLLGFTKSSMIHMPRPYNSPT